MDVEVPAAGISRETLRYYERRGIIAMPDRTLGGHRVYPPETVAMLKAVKTAQRLGFTLAEIDALLTAGGHADGDAGLQARTARKLAEIEQRITQLTAVAETLRQAITAGCDDLAACADTKHCPIPFTESATGDR